MPNRNTFTAEFALLFVFIFMFYFQIQFNSLYLNSIQPPTVIYVESTESKANNAINAKQLGCLTEAIYFEARGQPISGQKAVGHVIVNRTKDDQYPKTVCGVVHQRSSHGCQFSYVCSKHGTPKEPEAYKTAKYAAAKVLQGEVDMTRGSLYYHASYVNPYWSKKFNKTVYIGDHVFYNRS